MMRPIGKEQGPFLEASAAAPQAPVASKADHLQWFDAARGVAAIVVLLDHTNYVFYSLPAHAPTVTSAGLSVASAYAVYVFFFMSGYLITLSIRKNIVKNGRFDGRQYLVSRVLRIYPPLVGAILVVIAVGFLIDQFDLPALGLPSRPEYTFARDEIWMALTMRDGLGIPNGALWSLYIEGQIYIAVGGIVAIVWSRSWAVAILGVVAVIVAVRLRSNEWFWFYASIWALGSVLSLLPIPKRLGWLPAAPRWLTGTGDFSYSLYVVHFPLLLLLWSVERQFHDGFGLTHGVVAGAAIVAVVLFAMAFSLVFERPALRRKR